MEVEIKLSNVLYNFIEFYNKSTKLSFKIDVYNKLQIIEDKYSDVVAMTINNQFYPEENYELSIEILEFLLDNFKTFKNLFDYSKEELKSIYPGSVLANYSSIHRHLINIYQLNPDNKNRDIEIEENISEIIDFSNYEFKPGDRFLLKPEWKDGDEKDYVVVEDNGDRLLAQPGWNHGFSIIPTELIKKSYIGNLIKKYIINYILEDISGDCSPSGSTTIEEEKIEFFNKNEKDSIIDKLYQDYQDYPQTKLVGTLEMYDSNNKLVLTEDIDFDN